MKKPTPEELREPEVRAEAVQQMLQEHIARITAELEAQQKHTPA